METKANTEIKSNDEHVKQVAAEPPKTDKRAMKIRLKSGVTAGHMIAVHL